MSDFVSLLMGLGVLAAFLLIGGGIALLRKGGDRKRGWLMIVAGLVTLANIYLYLTLPPLPA